MVDRHVRGVVRNFERNLPSDEQYVSTSRLSVALVHGFPYCCVLVLYCCLVVAAVNIGSSNRSTVTSLLRLSCNVLTRRNISLFDYTHPLKSHRRSELGRTAGKLSGVTILIIRCRRGSQGFTLLMNRRIFLTADRHKVIH